MSERNLALFASGNGSNAEEIMNYFEKKGTARVACVLTNNPQAFVIDRARNHNVDCLVFNREEYKSGNEILAFLKQRQVTHIVLAGFLWLIPKYLLDSYPSKIINIHPAQ